MPVPLGSRGLKGPELQAFGLLDVEDVVQLDERPVPLDPFELWPPPLVADRLALLVAGRALLPEVDVHDGGSRLALAYVPSRLLDLAVATPARVGVATVEPLHGKVDGVATPTVASAAEVVRHDPLARLPRFLPRRGPFLQRLDDPLGDLLVVLVGPLSRASSLTASTSSTHCR